MLGFNIFNKNNKKSEETHTEHIENNVYGTNPFNTNTISNIDPFSTGEMNNPLPSQNTQVPSLPTQNTVNVNPFEQESNIITQSNNSIPTTSTYPTTPTTSTEQNTNFYSTQSYNTSLNDTTNNYKNLSKDISTTNQLNLQGYVAISPEDLKKIIEDYVQELVENILNEKLKDFESKFEEQKIWKEKTELELTKLKETIDKLERKMDSLYDNIVKKVNEYDQSIRETSVELQALHRLLRTMVPAISESIKELKTTIEDFKALKESLKKPEY